MEGIDDGGFARPDQDLLDKEVDAGPGLGPFACPYCRGRTSPQTSFWAFKTI